MHKNENAGYPDISIPALTFWLANQEYGLPLSNIERIIEMVAITPLPDAPRAIWGIITYQGQIVPVMDLRLHFGLPSKAYGLYAPIILVKCNQYTLGLIIDKVADVLHIPQENIETVATILPVTLMNDKVHHTKTITMDHHIILILQIEALLSCQEQSALLKAISNYQPEESLLCQ